MSKLKPGVLAYIRGSDIPGGDGHVVEVGLYYGLIGVKSYWWVKSPSSVPSATGYNSRDLTNIPPGVPFLVNERCLVPISGDDVDLGTETKKDLEVTA